MPYENPLTKVCGLWKSSGSKGEYLKGSIRDGELIFPVGTKLFVFPNERKRTERDPDYFASALLPRVQGNGASEPDDNSEKPEKPKRF